MDIDGGNPKQLTTGRFDQKPSISPDGKWVLYQSNEGPYPTAWKVSIDGGGPMQLSAQQAQGPRFSPDGKLIAYGYWSDKNEPMAAIISSKDGQLLKTFLLPSGFGIFDWTADGKALTFSIRGNIWAQPIAGGPPRWLTNFTTDGAPYHVWSRDGTQLAFTRHTQVSDIVLISDLR
jgi:Tol biopolymer transport system component